MSLMRLSFRRGPSPLALSWRGEGAATMTALAAIIAPRGMPGEGVLGTMSLADLVQLFPAASNEGSVAVATDLGGGTLVWARGGQWRSYLPAIEAEAAARTAADAAADNRIAAAEQALGSDPGDLTLLFDNGLI